MSFVVHATWKARPGAEADVRSVLEELAQSSRLEPGNRCYQPYGSPDEPSTFRIFEVYDDEVAFRAHTETPHFKRLVLDAALPLLAERERSFFQTIDDPVNERSNP